MQTTVRFAPWIATSFMIIGAATTLVVAALAIRTRPEYAIACIGTVGLIGFGWAYRGRIPYFRVTDSVLVVPIQPIHNRSLDGGRLAVENGRLLLLREGRRPAKLPVRRSQAHPGDWAKLVAAIEQSNVPRG